MIFLKKYSDVFMCERDFHEKMACDIVKPQQRMFSGAVKVPQPFYLYQDMQFGAGELIETLPEQDKEFNEKKRLCVKFENTYRELLNTELNPDLCKRWLRRKKQVGCCGNLLDFQGDKLAATLFCHVRLCPMCAWRRAIKICMHTRMILDKMMSDEGKKFKFLFLTLTVPNVKDDELAGEITHLMQSWRKMTHVSKNVRSIVPNQFNQKVLGWYRGLEITRNQDMYQVDYVYDSSTGKKIKVPKIGQDGFAMLNPNFLTWHPHFHNILVVPADMPEADLAELLTIRDSKGRIVKESCFLDWWRWATGDSSITQVDCKEFRPSAKVLRNKEYQKKYSANELLSMAIVSGVAEAAKYTVKATDYYLDADATKILDLALERRQLVAYGGIMSKYRNLLKLDDEIDGDLVASSMTPEDLNAVRRTYAFSVGFNCYVRIR